MNNLRWDAEFPFPIPFTISIWTQSHFASLLGPATDGLVADVFAYIPAGWVTRVRLDSMQWTGIGPSQMGPLHARDFPPRRADSYVVVSPGQGRPDRRRSPCPRRRRRAFLDTQAFGPGPVAASAARSPSPRDRPAGPCDMVRVPVSRTWGLFVGIAQYNAFRLVPHPGGSGVSTLRQQAMSRSSSEHTRNWSGTAPTW